MNDEQLQLRQMAIRERRKLLKLLYSKNGRQYEKTGLVSLARIIFILAARHVERPEWPGHVVEESVELCWELEWYYSYLSALAELVPPLQTAILNGEITPRGTLTRAPLDFERLRPWLELNPSAEIAKASKSHWEITFPDTQNEIVWPDAAVMPNVRMGVTIEDVSTWAESKKIVSPGELATLMQRGAQEPPIAPADMLKRVKDELRFDDEMRISYQSVRKDAAGNPYHVKGAKRWLKTVSVIGLITPRQFMALMLEGMRNTNHLMHGGLNESHEREIITAWAGFIREALDSGEISTRDDVTGLPIGKMGCAPHIDILDCCWCMSVSDAVKLAASKGAKIDFVAIAEHLYKIYFEDEAAPLELAAPGAKAEALQAITPEVDVLGTSPSGYDWKVNAKRIGKEIFANKLSLNVEQIAEKTHDEMNARHKKNEIGMTGRGGRVPSAGTIKRHALTGIKT